MHTKKFASFTLQTARHFHVKLCVDSHFSETTMTLESLAVGSDYTSRFLVGLVNVKVGLPRSY